MTSIIAAMQDSLLLIESSKIDWKKIERLPNLRLLASTGLRNAAIDLEAAAKHGRSR
jgi:phosphoglycerate dehydrogenase-like enzyme